MSKLIWKFDMLIYRLFYWRWNKRLSARKDLQRLFLDYLNSGLKQTKGDKKNGKRI